MQEVTWIDPRESRSTRASAMVVVRADALPGDRGPRGRVPSGSSSAREGFASKGPGVQMLANDQSKKSASALTVIARPAASVTIFCAPRTSPSRRAATADADQLARARVIATSFAHAAMHRRASSCRDREEDAWVSFSRGSRLASRLSSGTVMPSSKPPDSARTGMLTTGRNDARAFGAISVSVCTTRRPPAEAGRPARQRDSRGGASRPPTKIFRQVVVVELQRSRIVSMQTLDEDARRIRAVVASGLHERGVCLRFASTRRARSSSGHA